VTESPDTRNQIIYFEKSNIEAFTVRKMANTSSDYATVCMSVRYPYIAIGLD